ncbi:MAG: exodeoxyribonuclease VII large subunit [Oscillospiraceae bacterium]|jgi:exodeoxyribonuclease VII large subunit|nr:exodeoxyribonuclease VII large subunit [Oscillospiraceae bacterium]
MQSDRVYSVSEINQWIKQLIESDRRLADVYIKGELSNYKIYPSGHHYFTLKDENGVLKGVMFRGEASKLVFRPESGMKVIIRGRISVYPRDGLYQLYASEMIAEGAGALYLAFEQLKKRLGDKGYFDESRKRPIPKYPQRICIITSPAGAAVRDMLRILRKRYPVCEVILLPVRVQGEEAPGEIAYALDYANRHGLGEVIIAGRGGGSMEDLWAFNDERVAEAIYCSAIPVISAVGHEPDFTISDFVADLRAATPSNAAELAVPDMKELYIRLNTIDSRIRASLDRQMKFLRQRYSNAAGSRVMQDPMNYVNDMRMQLDAAENMFKIYFKRGIAGKRAAFEQMAAALDALSPLAVLGRGYSIATREGRALTSVKGMGKGDKLELRLTDGVLDCVVENQSILKEQ